MKLLNKFYTIESVQNNDNELVFQIKLNNEHYIYKAHFPENPITPGVCIIQIAQELLEEYLNVRLQLKVLHNIKYMSILSPITSPKISIQLLYNKNSEVIKLKGVIKDVNTTFTKFSSSYIVL